MKKMFAALVIAGGIGGTFVDAAPSASAITIDGRLNVDGDPTNDERLCVRVNITLFGKTIGTGRISSASRRRYARNG